MLPGYGGVGWYGGTYGVGGTKMRKRFGFIGIDKYRSNDMCFFFVNTLT